MARTSGRSPRCGPCCHERLIPGAPRRGSGKVASPAGCTDCRSGSVPCIEPYATSVCECVPKIVAKISATTNAHNSKSARRRALTAKRREENPRKLIRSSESAHRGRLPKLGTICIAARTADVARSSCSFAPRIPEAGVSLAGLDSHFGSSAIVGTVAKLVACRAPQPRHRQERNANRMAEKSHVRLYGSTVTGSARSLTRFSGQFTCRHHAASAAAAGLLSYSTGLRSPIEV